jgi:hypothetical protein
MYEPARPVIPPPKRALNKIVAKDVPAMDFDFG